MSSQAKTWLYIGIGVVVLAVAIGFCLRTVRTEHLGILTLGGEVTGTIDEGFHLVNPFKAVNQMSMQQHTLATECATFSQENQDVHATVNLVFMLKNDKESIIEVFRKQTTDPTRWTAFIAPIVQSTLKTVTIKYPITVIVSQRDVIQDETIRLVRESLAAQFDHYEIIRFEIANMDYSARYKEEIENRNKMAQEALRAKEQLEKERNLAQIEIIQSEAQIQAARNVAEATVIRAQAQSEAFKKMNEGISWHLVLWEAIQKWNGVLPFGGDTRKEVTK